MVSIASARARLRRAVNLGLTRPIVLLSVGVLVPIVLATTVGIVTLSLSESSRETIVGVLAVVLATAAFVSGIVLTVWLGRRARMARLQSDLLSNVSHELKTPLAAIRMYGQTLESGDASTQDIAMCARGIVRETHWLETMVERLLTWRAVPRDRADLSLRDQSLAETLRLAADRFERMFPADAGQFTAGPLTDRYCAHDRAAIVSVVTNLLTNAYKYSASDKEISLSLSIAGDGAVITVADNGYGIPAAEQARILEPFYRIDDKRRAGAGGAGLGLAIVAALVAAHGGRLDIESAPNEGSRFSVILPLQDGDES